MSERRRRSRSRSRSKSPSRRSSTSRSRRRRRSSSRSRSRSRSRSPARVKREEDSKKPKVEEPASSTLKAGLAEQRRKLAAQKEELLRRKASLAGAGAPPVPPPAGSAVLPSVAAAAASGPGPIALLLDEQGRQVDEHGNLVVQGGAKAALNKSLLINKRLEREKVFGGSASSKAAAVVPETSNAAVSVIDRRVAMPRAGRKRREFQFVEPGSIVRKADRQRAEVKMEMFNRELQESGKDVAELMQQHPDLAMQLRIGLDTTGREFARIPDVEWWDAQLVELLPGHESVDDGAPRPMDQSGGAERKEEAKPVVQSYAQLLALVGSMVTTTLIEHPKVSGQSKALEKLEKEVTIPLMLTKEERKRIRREERMAKQEELRAKITLGLVPPPPPKVKLSNMERVYGSRMVENPTAVEAEVRKAMQDRLMKHLLDNESRKKTPAERREKQAKAAQDDRKAELRVAVFKIDGLLRNNKGIWKATMNARQMHCTGVLVHVKPLVAAAGADGKQQPTPPPALKGAFNLMVVEGGPKAVKFMKKLMLRRINWSGGDDGDDDDVDDANDADGDVNAGPSGASNRCVMVWEGAIARQAFNKFESHECEDMMSAREVLDKGRVPQYWDQAKNFRADAEVVAMQLKKL